MRSTEKGLDICGGYIFSNCDGNFTNCDGHSLECFRLPYNNDTWLRSPIIPAMNQLKSGSTVSASLGQDRWFISGKLRWKDPSGDWVWKDPSGNYVLSAEVRNKDDTWTISKPPPVPPDGYCMVSVDSNRVLFVGGTKSGTDCLASTYMFDIQNNSWERRNDMLSGRIVSSCTRLNKDQILVTGGKCPHSDYHFNSSEIYSISTGQWSLGPSLPKGISGAQMITVDDVTYHFGGYYFPAEYGETTKDVYRLEKNTNPWHWKKTAELKNKIHPDSTLAPIKLSPDNCNGWKGDKN